MSFVYFSFFYARTYALIHLQFLTMHFILNRYEKNVKIVMQLW